MTLQSSMFRVVAAVALSAGAWGASVSAQAPAPPDFSKVEIQSTQLAPGLFRLEAVGPVLVGNAGILTGPDGVFMVDAMFAQLSDKLLAAVKSASNGGQVKLL